MLPKRARVDTNTFEQIMKNGRVIHTPHFSFRYILPVASASVQDTSVRISAVATKKIFKTAVARHAITRKIYRAVREIGLQLTFPPLHLVVFAKVGAEKISFEEMVLEIKNCLVEKM